MSRLSTLSLALSLVALGSTHALADVDSLVTVGIGSAVTMTRSKDLSQDALNQVGAEINLRLKLFRVLGAELAMDPGQAKPEGQLIFDSTYRLSGLLYLVPLDFMGVYAKAGIGGRDITDLVSVLKPTNSYHAGGGIDFYIAGHVSIGGEFLVLVPGVASMQTAIAKHALTSADAETKEAASEQRELSISDFLSAQNFRASLAVRYYF